MSFLPLLSLLGCANVVTIASAKQIRNEDVHLSSGTAPLWATLQLQLLGQLSASALAFSERYLDQRARLKFEGNVDDSRDGADDFLEPFAVWPLLAEATGSRDLSELTDKIHGGVTLQLDDLGFTNDGVDLGTDWFHQGEGNQFRYNLLAIGRRGLAAAMVVRQANSIVDPAYGNYDPRTNILRAPHPGVMGPRWGYRNRTDDLPFDAGMERYGLPLVGIDGVRAFADLNEPVASRSMGRAMRDRMGRGDVAMNLASTGVVLAAWRLTGEIAYSNWITRYVDGWIERAERNGGLLPDNVGVDGVVGSYQSGSWWGGLYGWHWPHGFHSVANAAAVGSLSAFEVSGDDRYLDLIRGQLDSNYELGRTERLTESVGALRNEYLSRFEADELHETALLTPHRFGPDGWFDYLPAEPTLPLAIWRASGRGQDLARIERLKAASSYDWKRVRATRLKEDSGHEEPWFEYLAGRNADYPSDSMKVSLEVLAQRERQIEEDLVGAGSDVHHWQRLNPVSMEHLLHLRYASPSPIYYGGLLSSRVRVTSESKLAVLTSENHGAVQVELVNTGSQVSATVEAFGQSRSVHVPQASAQIVELKFPDANR